MPFKKGNTFGRGRPKGSKGKFSDMKEQFLAAYEHIGGLAALITWAKQPKNQSEFYKMLSKLFPKEIIGELKIGKSVSELTIPELVEIITGEGAPNTAAPGNGKPDTLH